MSDKKNHKSTWKCPVFGCKYTSRIPNTNFYLNNKNSVHSKFCPNHRRLLIPK